jgi:signal transduction histidine kinase
VPRDYRVDVDPHVVFELGETLVTDDVGAIVELVKNAYDADATSVRIRVESQAHPPAGSYFPDTHGFISVEDDGTGMGEDDIRRGWLIVAHSGKREAKDRGEKTPVFGRTPLGDKGLGRLGTQRLGYAVELFTSKTKSPDAGEIRTRFHVGIDWRDFDQRATLAEIPVRVERTNSAAVGTRVLVSELRNPGEWSTQSAGELQQRLSQFIFPFEGKSAIRISGTVDGVPLDLVQVTRELLETATSNVIFKYSNGVLEIDLRYSLQFVRPQSRAEVARWDRLVADDRGRAFHRFLAGRDGAPGTLGRLATGNGFIKVAIQRDITHLGGLAYVHDQRADPGSFEGRITTFDLGPSSVREAPMSDYRAVVRAQAGVKVFRDGFAIRPYGMAGNDWLRLGHLQTRGGSFYGLRPGNVIGYVNIGADGNRQLEEKTDREGFTDSASARNFVLIMDAVVDQVNLTNEWIRRAYNDYRHDSRGNAVAVVSPAASLRIASAAGNAIAHQAESLGTSISAISRVADELASRPASTRAANELRVIGAALEASGAELRLRAEQLANVRSAVSVLEEHVRMLESQADEFTELAALGLGVEAAAHELRNVTNTLYERARRMSSAIRRQRATDQDVDAFIEDVRSTVAAVRKQLSHLEPSLQYVRERRDEFRLSGFVNELVEFHQPSFARVGISLVGEASGDDSVLVMNRGRLTQVMENLLLNSKYWLKQGPRRPNPEVLMRYGDGVIDVIDSGPGVDPALEERLFEPFVTNKPRGVGRGLGLFVARRLLQSTGGRVELLSDRNEAGRRYIFRVTPSAGT